MNIFEKQMPARLILESNLKHKEPVQIPKEIKREGHTVNVPELKTSVFIRKGKTLKEWLISQQSHGLISKSLWEKLENRYITE